MVGDKARAIYDKEAKERLKTKGGHSGMVILPEAKGTARDAAGKALGVSGKDEFRDKTMYPYRLMPQGVMGKPKLRQRRTNDMLIFDQFKTLASANRFAHAATRRFGLSSVVCRNWDEFDELEAFPFDLSFPVALVDRADFDIEEDVMRLAPSFGCQFAGT